MAINTNIHLHTVTVIRSFSAFMPPVRTSSAQGTSGRRRDGTQIRKLQDKLISQVLQHRGRGRRNVAALFPRSLPSSLFHLPPSSCKWCWFVNLEMHSLAITLLHFAFWQETNSATAAISTQTHRDWLPACLSESVRVKHSHSLLNSHSDGGL